MTAVPARAQPKPVKRKTLKRRRRAVKNANIADVRHEVTVRDAGCRISLLLLNFGFNAGGDFIELAHLENRGMGGNPTLSRDTTANTIAAYKFLHQGRRSLHSGHIKVEALTDNGADGPIAITFYEKLPTEL